MKKKYRYNWKTKAWDQLFEWNTDVVIYKPDHTYITVPRDHFFVDIYRNMHNK